MAAKGGKDNIQVDTSAQLCGQCHVRGAADEIPAKGGFIQHHEQYNELLASPHKRLDCVDWHDPHKKAEFSIKAGCDSCHARTAKSFEGSTMQKVGLTCADCHLPKATKSAVAVSPNEGDVRTHLFRINSDPAASMFTEDVALAKDFVTLNFVCLPCHQDKDVNWAAANIAGIHSLGK